MARKHEVWIQWIPSAEGNPLPTIRVWDAKGKLLLDSTPSHSFLARSLGLDPLKPSTSCRSVSVVTLDDVSDETAGQVWDDRGNLCLLSINRGTVQIVHLSSGSVQEMKFKAGTLGLDADIVSTWHRQFQFRTAELPSDKVPNRVANTIAGIVTKTKKKPGRKSGHEPRGS